MGNGESSPRHRRMETAGHPKAARHHSDPSAPKSSPGVQRTGNAPSAQRSMSVPMRSRLESVGSYCSSMEGGYTDLYDGMTPLTFGGNYRKATFTRCFDVPRKCKPQSFDEAHGDLLKMPFDSKHGSGFDLDWQYDKKKRDRVVAKHALNPDHPLYHKLTPKIVEVIEEHPIGAARHTQV